MGCFEMKVTLYTTSDCPNCRGLKKILKLKNIEFNEVQDLKIMEPLGIKSVPMMDLGDHNLMNLYQIMQWLKTI